MSGGRRGCKYSCEQCGCSSFVLHMGVLVCSECARCGVISLMKSVPKIISVATPVRFFEAAIRVQAEATNERRPRLGGRV